MTTPSLNARDRRTRSVMTGVLVVLCVACLDQANPQDSQKVPSVPPEGAGRWSFALGDIGTGGPGQVTVAAVLARTAKLYRPAFIVLLGDNFYERGVSSITDSLWLSRFEYMYDSTALPVPFYAILGNHDYLQRGSVEAQIAYTTLSTRWRMPATYYTFVDTVTFRDRQNVTVRWVGIDSDALVRNLQLPRQVSWIDSVLAADTSHWTIVFGHHPLFGTGPYGNTPELQQSLRPVLERHRVTIYLAAHAHNLQVSRPINGVTYVVSGGGAAFDRAHPIDASPEIAFGMVTGGFAAIAVLHDHLLVQMIDHHGWQLFETTLTRPD